MADFEHDAIGMASSYHPRVWLFLESICAVLMELPPERWPAWAIDISSAYASDFRSAKRCCGMDELEKRWRERR